MSDVEYLRVGVTGLVEAYETREGPFAEELMPEATPAGDLSKKSDRALFLTFGSILNYQRSSERLWESMEQLWAVEPWMFSPESVSQRSVEDIKEILQSYGARFPNNDADGWHRVATTLYEEFDGRPEALLAATSFDAVELVELVRKHDGFPYLGGKKIAPMWARFMHENVDELDRVAELDIPVDVQVRKVTKAVVEPVLDIEFEDDDQIRVFWLEFCAEVGVDPTRVDKPFWIIGAYWEDWGKEYLQTWFPQVAASDSSHG
jgi:hypothetical protein